MNTEINPKLLDVVEYRVGSDLFTGTVIDTLGGSMVLIEGSDESGVTRRLDTIRADEIRTIKAPHRPAQEPSASQRHNRLSSKESSYCRADSWTRREDTSRGRSCWTADSPAAF